MKIDKLVRNLRHVEQGYAEKHYSVGEVRVCDMAKDCADALESLSADLAPFQAAAAEYGIDAQTMLTLARSQIATAKENVRLREENEELRENFADYVCSGVPNPAPYCANKADACVDKLGWCANGSKECKGFSPDPPQKGE